MANVCKKCGEKIPLHTKINGKWKSTGKRRYCFTCSPMRNTKILRESGLSEPKPLNKICPKCGKEFKYTKNNVCSTCRNKAWRHKQKLEYVKLLGGKCQICDYSKCINTLEFHHIDETNKKFGISEAFSFHLEKRNIIIKEVKKCILLCANCHRELHAGFFCLLKAQ